MANKVKWEGIYSLGKQSDTYLEATYKGMHCEMHYNNRLGSVPMAWDWSFYDGRSYDPDLAVARSDEGHATIEEATAEMTDYIDGYVAEKRASKAVR